MRPSIFLLVLASALLHAGWNFATRSISGSLAAVWLGLWLGCALLLPAALAVLLAKGFGAALPL